MTRRFISDDNAAAGFSDGFRMKYSPRLRIARNKWIYEVNTTVFRPTASTGRSTDLLAVHWSTTRVFVGRLFYTRRLRTVFVRSCKIE